MSRSMGNMLPDLQAMARAAKAIGVDIAKTKEELERLITMIVKDKKITKKKEIIKAKEKNVQGVEVEIDKVVEIEEEEDATVEDMITATFVLVLQDEKFRKHVPGPMIQQLMLASTAVRDYENRKLTSILPAIKARVRGDLLMILHKAYPAWQTLVPNATSNMIDSMSYERRQENDNNMLNQYRRQHSLGPPGE